MSLVHEAYRGYPRRGLAPALEAHLSRLLQQGLEQLESAPHGDLPRWMAAIEALPRVPVGVSTSQGLPCLGGDSADPGAVRAQLMVLHPWRKGPLRLAGVDIDTEWRSDWKWARIAPHVEMAGHHVLDVGCGNGYYGWRMLEAGAASVMGIDPTLVFVFQWLACRHFSGPTANIVLPMGIDAFPQTPQAFDTVFSMGVLYHRKDPVQHLRQLASLVRPGGQIVLETLVLEDDRAETLVPAGRYARMRNVWAVPSIPSLKGWLREAGLERITLLDVSRTTTGEQRSTEWMQFESLDRCLDPDDPQRTVEGHPAPVRAVLRIEPG